MSRAVAGKRGISRYFFAPDRSAARRDRSPRKDRRQCIEGAGILWPQLSRGAQRLDRPAPAAAPSASPGFSSAENVDCGPEHCGNHAFEMEQIRTALPSPARQERSAPGPLTRKPDARIPSSGLRAENTRPISKSRIVFAPARRLSRRAWSKPGSRLGRKITCSSFIGFFTRRRFSARYRAASRGRASLRR